MLLAHPVWAHAFLLLGWFSLYLMTYPFLSLFKGKNLAQYQKWTLIYFVAALIFAIPALIYNWQVLYFMFAMLPLVAVNIYFTKKKDERNLWNDLSGIVIFALAGMGSYYFSGRIFHLLCVLIFAFSQQFILALAFVPGLIRAIYLPSKKLSVKQVGLTEFAITAIFFILLLFATL